jgi:putative endonuclease
MSRESRRLAWARGRRAESLAACWLRLKGYRILGRNFRVPVGEIDLIARRGRVCALVEVKSRADLLSAGEAVDRRQRVRIARAATVLLRRRPDLRSLALRFDVVLFAPGRLPRHLPDAWRLDDGLPDTDGL